jgi:hypothetical protein
VAPKALKGLFQVERRGHDIHTPEKESRSSSPVRSAMRGGRYNVDTQSRPPLTGGLLYDHARLATCAPSPNPPGMLVAAPPTSQLWIPGCVRLATRGRSGEIRTTKAVTPQASETAVINPGLREARDA